MDTTSKNPTKLIVNALTGDVTEVELTAEEIAELQSVIPSPPPHWRNAE